MNQISALGQLGQGDGNHRGDGADEMGDNLSPVDLGDDFEIESVYPLARGYCGMWYFLPLNVYHHLLPRCVSMSSGEYV